MWIKRETRWVNTRPNADLEWITNWIIYGLKIVVGNYCGLKVGLNGALK